MKSFIFILTYIFCVKAFACPNLTGSWVCTDPKTGESGPITIEMLNQNGVHGIKTSLGGEYPETFWLDGNVYNDNSGLTYSGTCTEDAIKLLIKDKAAPKDSLDQTLKLSDKGFVMTYKGYLLGSEVDGTLDCVLEQK